MEAWFIPARCVTAAPWTAPLWRFRGNFQIQDDSEQSKMTFWMTSSKYASCQNEMYMVVLALTRGQAIIQNLTWPAGHLDGPCSASLMALVVPVS